VALSLSANIAVNGTATSVLNRPIQKPPIVLGDRDANK
jgi:hypothetical protein